MLFRIAVVPKLLGNFLLMVNVVPGTLDNLHAKCSAQGLDTSHIHHPVYKPSLTFNKNSVVIRYVHQEQPGDKQGHL